MKITAWIPPALFYLLLIGLSSLPASEIPGPEIPHADKAAHLAVYTVLGILLGRTGAAWPFTLSAGLLAGALDECYQSFTPGRSPDPWDFVADAIGIGIGLALVHVYRAYRTSPKPQS